MKQDTECFSDWFGMIRNGSETDARISRHKSYLLGLNPNPILPPEQ